MTKKILIINPFGIGDVLFTTPLIKAIKDSQPNTKISYWCNERVKEIFKNDPRIDKVFALSRGDLKRIFQYSTLDGIKKFLGLFISLKKERFDATIDLSLDHRYGLLTKLLGIKKRVGFNYKKRGRFLTQKIGIDSYRNKHIIEYYLDLLKFFEIKAKTKEMEVFASRDNLNRVKSILTQSGIKEGDLVVGIAPGAGASWGQNAAYKHWPAIKYAQLADKLIDTFGGVRLQQAKDTSPKANAALSINPERSGNNSGQAPVFSPESRRIDNYAAKILILGDASEKPIADIITATMRNKAIDLTGKITLGELIAIIKRLGLLIANDGGPLHIAIASNIKTVSIFGPVDEIVYGPYPIDNHIVIKNNTAECRPCYKNFRLPVCDKDNECLKQISVDTVFTAAIASLRANESERSNLIKRDCFGAYGASQ